MGARQIRPCCVCRFTSCPFGNSRRSLASATHHHLTTDRFRYVMFHRLQENKIPMLLPAGDFNGARLPRVFHSLLIHADDEQRDIIILLGIATECLHLCDDTIAQSLH